MPAHCRGDAGLDVERVRDRARRRRSGTAGRRRSSRCDGVADELVHLVVPGELVVAVHDHRDRRGPRGGVDGFEHVPRVAPDPAGADAPVAVAVRRAPRARARLLRLGRGGDDVGLGRSRRRGRRPRSCARRSAVRRAPRHREQPRRRRGRRDAADPTCRARPCVRCVRRSCRRTRPMAGHSTVAAPGEPAATAPRRPVRACRVPVTNGGGARRDAASGPCARCRAGRWRRRGAPRRRR